jgi:ABC-2 type transport system ATP-binding protein
MPDEIYSIEITGFRKQYNNVWAVNGIDLLVKRGTFFGFVGPNGAGKSTTINAMCGLIRQSSGTIKIEGYDIAKEPLEVKRRIGVMLEEPVLYQRLTGREYLIFVGEMIGLDQARIQERLFFLLDVMNLEPDKLMGNYSLGMKKKVALAAALIHEPPLIILDEPFSGVDATSASKIRKVLNDLVAAGHTVFFSSHVLETVERLSNEVGIIHKGRLLASGSLDQIRTQSDSPSNATLEDVFLKLVGAVEVRDPTCEKPSN